ncbi:SusC/RagA family TonB-linked outer membrane protein [Mangrovibacterium lignilyticum]|uniref:SusC/RagA family TonB-linked outer membrane protein n=1 Tax=Mangrovibacterium lignilyticum TaxID=2668052 RepID=UPI0019686D97|nr:SusC/RagA family TonB-linked outer membrane protein [Mangrovibacterium lignilyticum]
MKLTFLIVLISVMSSLASQSYSQSTRITMEVRDTRIEDFLRDIENQTEYRFFYSAKIDVDQKVSGDFKDLSIQMVLDEILQKTGIGYEINGRQIILSNATTGANAQQVKSVSGEITDTAGNSLPGVTVVVKGTTNGTITDYEGRYTISNLPADAILVFSFVGMRSQEITVGTQSLLNVTLEDETIGLEEVVAVGYGTQSKRTVTGSIQSVDTDELSDMPVTTTAQKLQGKLSGVQINQTTGRPGEGMKIRIRGQASLTAGNDPLYVVDGFPITGDISSLNPNEIESISVLKDASSAALYGSRAANGVILVTTKRGKIGKTSISIASNYGWQTVPQKGRPDAMNATEYAQFKKESLEDLGLPVPEMWQNPSQYGAGTNFYDELLQVAPMQDHSISFSSSNNNFATTAVIGYTGQDGVIENSDYKRYSMRINTDYNVSEKIKTGFSVAPTYSIANSPNTDGILWGGGLINNALTIWPIFDPMNEDGTMAQNFFDPVSGSRFENVLWSAQAISNETKNMRLLTNAFAQYEPISGLVIKTTFNFEYFNSKYKNVTPSTVGAATPSVASGRLMNRGYNTWLNENTITYKKSVGDHNFDLLGGITIQRYREDMTRISYNGFADDRVPTIAAAQNVDRSPYWLTGELGTYNDIQEWSMMSYLARINYNYKNRYLLSFAIRADGSSRFGSDNRWGSFPSASAGWIASDEEFMKGFEKLSLLKLRASFGVVGNNNIGNYTQYATVSTGSASNNAIFGSSVHSGSVMTSLPNSELTWEKTQEYDFGFDAGFFNNRINLSYDYYNRKTTSLLYSVNVAQESGFSSFMSNIGELKFWGHEIMLNTKNLVGEFSWETSFNISFTDNEVLSLAGDIDRIYSGLFDSNITKVGDKIGLLYGMVWDGVYDNQEEFDNSPKAVASEVGTIKFKDVGGGADGGPDGIITHGGDNDDRTVIGDPTPQFTYGITNTFAYKNFDLSVVMAGSYGNDIITWMDQSLANLDGNFNVYKDLKDRWRSESNPGAGRYGKTTSGTSNERDWVSSRFVSDGSYLTIKNVTLGYTVPTKKLSNLRVFMSIQQLYTFTKYRGANPESSNSFYSGNSTSALTLGSDFASFPVPRTVSFGINIGL